MKRPYAGRAADYLMAENAPPAKPHSPRLAKVYRAPDQYEHVIEALGWAWTNATGRLPDENTMSPDEIAKYWHDYQQKLIKAFDVLEGCHPDDYLRRKALS